MCVEGVLGAGGGGARNDLGPKPKNLLQEYTYSVSRKHAYIILTP